MAVRVSEHYRDWEPPIDGTLTVEYLLRGVPEPHLVGLGEVVLTNSSGLARGRRRARAWSHGQKIAVHQSRGLYHPAQEGELPWIELFVDRIYGQTPRWLLGFSFIREWLFGEVLFHELGHHIHATTRKEHADKESVAERWRGASAAAYFSRKYWYLRPLALPYGSLRRWTR